MVTSLQQAPQRTELRQLNALARQEEARLDDRAAESKVVVVNDPTLMMAEMAEELGFMKAEELGGTQEFESDQEAAFEDLIADLIKESLKVQSESPEQNRQDAEAMRARLVQMQISANGGQSFEDLIRRFTGGSSQKGLAIMAELVKMAQSDPELQRLGFGPKTLEDYALAHEAGLVAALNIAGALELAPNQAQDSAQRILGLYEESIATTQSVLQTFQRLGQTEGIGTIQEWRSFLTEAVAADLAKQNSGGEKVHLQLILTELKGFRTFNTLTQGLERLNKHLPKQGGPQQSELMQGMLDYIEQPIRDFPRVESWIQAEPLQKQILFFQGFRNLLKALPDDAYASPEQKSGTLIPPQKRVDDLTFSEDI